MAEAETKAAAPEDAQPRTFTQEEVNEIMGKVRREASSKYADYDEIKAKAARLDEIDERAKTELERANERAERAERELKQARERQARADMVSKVSRETGVPAELLKGATEAELAESAEAIKGYARASVPAYPQDKGGAAPGGAPITRETIESIKDPVARVRARAAHRDIYQ